MRKLLGNINANIPGLVVGVIALLIAVVIGLMIWYKTNTALFTTFKYPYAGVPYTAQNATYANINTTANSVWTLAPIIALVLIAGVIIATIMMFAGGGKKL